MFARRSRGLFEFAMALLCVWAAYWHTPVGALLRTTVAKVFGASTSARPLLAYYSGSGRAVGEGGVNDVALPRVGREVTVTPALAVGLGVHASLKALSLTRRREAITLARAHGVDPKALVDAVHGPSATAALMERVSATLGNEEAAVLAAFVGVEPARYALERARAEGVAAPVLDELVRHLPPGSEEAAGHAQEALTFGVAYGLGWPVPESTPISSGFGMRLHPVLGTTRMHEGVDLPLPIGTPVRVTADGVVVRASEDGVNGRILVVDHGRGVTTAYCHNQRLLVADGDVVRRGDVIAHSGNTGRSTGPHLHYQLELGAQPVDPLAFRPPRLDHVAGDDAL